MTDLIAELAEVVSQLRSYDDKSVVGVRLSALSESTVQFIRAHHVELTRILTDYPELRAAHHDLVIRLGEVTTRLEAAERGAKLFRLAEENAGKSISARGVRFELHFDARSDSSTMRDYLSVMRDSAGEGSND